MGFVSFLYLYQICTCVFPLGNTFLFCRNGGMCMHDEAAPHYIDMIDQTTLGHRFIIREFNVTPRIGWQIDPFGHSAVQAYLLGAEVSSSLGLHLVFLMELEV